MVSANHIDKEILTLGEKWQSFATSKLQQYHPQKKILSFRENLLKKVIKILDKWQVNDSDLQPLKSKFATNIQEKYLINANKFQRRQRQQNLSEETLKEEDLWEKFDLLQQPSPQIAINRQVLLTQQQSEIIKNITKKYNRVSSQQKTTLSDAEPVIDLVSKPKPLPQLESREIESKIEQSSYSKINAQLRNFLGNLLNIRIPNVKVYSNQVADNYAKKLNADAITYDDKILLRTGKYNPQKPETVALLGHELSHAANLVPQRANYHYPRSEAAEEKTALSNENKILNYFSLPGASISSLQPSVTSGNVVNSTQNNQLSQSSPTTIKKAESDRDLSIPETTNQMGISTMETTNLKEEIKREIIEEIRIDFERGG